VRQMIRWSLMACFLAALGACASGGGAKSSPGDAPTRRSDIINQTEIQRVQWRDAYDMVANLRPLWLRQRGADTITGEQGEIQILLDGVRLGGPSALRNMPLSGIASLQYFDPVTAASRFGLGFSHGAIYITQSAR